MKRVLGWVGATAIGFCSIWASASASTSAASFVLPTEEGSATPEVPWAGKVVGIPGPSVAEKRGTPGLPTFNRTVVARGRSYRYTMVGSDPYVARPAPVVVPLQIIPVHIEFNDGTVLDPTAPTPDCADPGTPLSNALESPLFTDVDYGEGGRQYVEEERRVEFWSLVGAKPRYSVRVAPVVLPTISLTYNGPAFGAPCGQAGFVPYSSLDRLIRTTLIPRLKGQGVSPRTFPLFLFTNVFFSFPDGSAAAGYHSAFNLGGVQTYGVAEYDSNQLDPHASDISVLSHEIAEWYDDPFGNNTTPPWGHTGQVKGCQSNLEVGDPLTGTTFEIPMPNGISYHPQELAFFSWFYNQVPSLGLQGLYSWGGTLTTPAAPCR